jgi:hypothetical protein
MLRTGQLHRAPPRRRDLARRRGPRYRGPWRLPGPDSHRLAAVSLSLGYTVASSLSVRGPPVNEGSGRRKWDPCPRCWPCVTGRGRGRRGQGGAPAAMRGRTTLTPARAVAGSGSQGGIPGQRIGTTPRRDAGGGAAMARARGRPALSWSADPRSGDMMLDGVIPHAGAAARSFRAGQPGVGRQENCRSWPRLISGVGRTRTSRIGQATCPTGWVSTGGANAWSPSAARVW